MRNRSLLRLLLLFCLLSTPFYAQDFEEDVIDNTTETPVTTNETPATPIDDYLIIFAFLAAAYGAKSIFFKRKKLENQ